MKTESLPSGSLETIPALPPGVRTVTLDNGLQLILLEDHSAPVVSAQAWCRAGSIHEGKWLGAGLSHVLEHMLFKGTTTRGPGRIDQEVHNAGGSMNAYTSFDRTVYHIDVPNTGAVTAIDILCDIMQHATLPESELAKELDVIRREMDMGHDDPGMRSSRRLFETAYTRSPYRFPIIGYPDIFNELTREDIFQYYREKYAPNNVFLVVAGDMDPEAVVAQVRQAFAESKARALPPVVLPEEPKQLAGREVIETAPIELAHLHFSWHIPDLRHPDVPVLDVLATILGSGRSSRLYQQVRERQGLVVSADAWTYSPGSAGLFGMSALVETEKFEAASCALLAEIDRLQQTLIPDAELAKAVKQFVAGTLSMRKTMSGQAQDLGGSWLAASDLNFSQRYLAAVKRITPAELQRVARHYLTPENRTLYALLPEGAAKKVFQVAIQPAVAPARKFDLPNGLRLIVREDHRLPFVEYRALLRGGILAETPQNNGVALLSSKLLMKGTASRSAEQIAREIESLGGSIDSYSANNSFGVTVEVMSGDFSAGLELLSDVLLNPVFPEEALERERQVQLAAIRAQRDHLLHSALKAMRRALFGETGYGLDAQGTEATLPKLRTGDLKLFHQQLAAPSNCVLAIYGDVDTAAVEKAVAQAFARWQSPLILPAPAAPAPLAGITRLSEKRDKKQGVLGIGFHGSTIYHDDRYALELLQEACSDLGSRLFLRIREEQGLAYYVGAQNMLGLTPGYFAFYAGTEPEKVPLCEAEMLKEAALLAEKGLTAEELARTKAKVVGQKKIARQDIGHCATSAALDELYGLGFNFGETEDAKYEAVTIEDTQRVAGKYLTPAKMVISTVGP